METLNLLKSEEVINEEKEQIEVINAKVHNLKNISLTIPRNQLVVFTGLSGSGKSSLAFDTIYAEAQRRFLETLSAYARQFMGELERPDVDKINGLSPSISIEQKTVSKNPRSTVGTITEIYDFLRLLYARTADAYSPKTGKKFSKYTPEQILDAVQKNYAHKTILLLAPLVYGRKGHYNELFNQLLKKGYTRCRIDGVIKDLSPNLKLDRNKVHNIELIVDELEINIDNLERLTNSLQTALKMGENKVMVLCKEVNDRPILYSLNFTDEDTGTSLEDPSPNTFSFNSPYGWCPNCKGIGTVPTVNVDAVIKDPNVPISNGTNPDVIKFSKNKISRIIVDEIEFSPFTANLEYKQTESIIKNFKNKSYEELKNIYPELTLYVVTRILEKSILEEFRLPLSYVMSLEPGEMPDTSRTEKLREYVFKNNIVIQMPCPVCEGKRLKQEALYFKINNRSIGDLGDFSIQQLYDWLTHLPTPEMPSKQIVQEEILKELLPRIEFLLDVGLGYLTLNLPAYALSGGEAQRIRLATQLGSHLSNVLYILDEPSIGLHQRDNHRLITALQKLRDQNNSVIVVEHDKEMILKSDSVVDIGPGAGKHGGHIVFSGTPKELLQQHTITAQYLNNEKKIYCPPERRKGNGKYLTIKNCTGNYLKNISVSFPLGKFICITGVSGSGKSTLIMETLLPAVKQKLGYVIEQAPYPYESIEGIELIDRVIEIDQSPIGRTPRSNPATYTGVFDEIRKLFAETPEAKVRGYTQGRFSFNLKGGRCEECGGGGQKVLEMLFLPDVYITCPACQGKRYNRETLQVKYKGKNINDVLNMTIEEACVFFENHPKIYKKLKILNDIGLGYIQLGQSSVTLSGGEAQRTKLAAELYKRDTGKTLYILDEPTTGLHFEDINKLLIVLHKLVDNGNTVIVIEHNMDVIKTADHIIDLGPEGGKAGGYVLFEGTPEELIQLKDKNDTAKFLALEFS
ncbi:MAG: excinuclease ABC subunit UvrA [Bacteroidia bacterium]|nr:excinuclease ABC subunit UvrA [Bacteroidia bacterium]